MRGATAAASRPGQRTGISIHAPHAGRDRTTPASVPLERYFNPRAPCGARPGQSGAAERRYQNFNPRAPCGARPAAASRPGQRTGISIHAPHAGRDQRHQHLFGQNLIFQSTRPMRGATASTAVCASTEEFQSTRPMRGATCGFHLRNHFRRDFNPRAPCGARRFPPPRILPRFPISIHAPHAGRDYGFARQHRRKTISIHAPHAGRDVSRRRGFCRGFQFQSTRPMRGATSAAWDNIVAIFDFNPRAPCGARPVPPRSCRPPQ